MVTDPSIWPAFKDITEKLILNRYHIYFDLKEAEFNDYESLFYPVLIEQIKKIKDSQQMKILADNGNPTPMVNYGLLLWNMKPSPEKNQETDYFKKSADQGNGNSMFHYGDGIKANQEEANKYLHMATDWGNSLALVDYNIIINDNENPNNIIIEKTSWQWECWNNASLWNNSS